MEFSNTRKIWETCSAFNTFFHALIINFCRLKISINHFYVRIKNSLEETIFDIILEIKLIFCNHMKELSTLSIIFPYSDSSQKNLIFQSSYLPPTYVDVGSRTSNNKMNKIHEYSLRAILDDKISSFVDMFDKILDVKNHWWNIQVLIQSLLNYKQISTSSYG